MTPPNELDTIREQLCSILYDNDFPILGNDEQKRIEALTAYVTRAKIEELELIKTVIHHSDLDKELSYAIEVCNSRIADLEYELEKQLGEKESMSNAKEVKTYMDTYQYLVGVIGDEEKLNQLILLERAANQRHWADNLRKQLTAPLKNKDKLIAIGKILDDMDEEANRYDPLGEK